MFLTESESQALESIAKEIEAGVDIFHLQTSCNINSKTLFNSELAYTFAAILMAKKGNIDEAIALLNRASTCPFSQSLSVYLGENRTLTRKAKAFSTTVPYDVWVQSPFYKRFKMGTISSLVEGLPSPPSSLESRPLTVIDIGPGNGVLLRELLERLHARHSFGKLHLVLIEQSQAMLDAAIEHLRLNALFDVTFTRIQSFVETLDALALSKFVEHGAVWFTLASASIHHMPKAQKIETASKIRMISPVLAISEFQGNHDLTEADSPELICSVVSFYGYFIQDILRTPETPERIRECIEGLPLSEALTIIGNSRYSRVDYHTTQDQWEEILFKAGYSSVIAKVTVHSDERPVTYTLLAE